MVDPMIFFFFLIILWLKHPQSGVTESYKCLSLDKTYK